MCFDYFVSFKNELEHHTSHSWINDLTVRDYVEANLKVVVLAGVVEKFVQRRFCTDYIIVRSFWVVNLKLEKTPVKYKSVQNVDKTGQ